MSLWPRAAIGDLVEDVVTWNPSQAAPDATFNYIDLSAVDQGSKSITEARQLLCAEAPSRARQIVSTGDVLVSTVRPNLNGVAKVPMALHGATASTGFCVLRPREDRLDSGFLLHWVRTPSFVAQMVSKATGASYPAVSARVIFESCIPFPSLLEQRRIAMVLDTAEALRSKRRAALDQLDTLTEAIFLDMFGDPATNPKRWPVERLKDIVRRGTKVTYGIVQAGEEFARGVPYIRTGDIVNGEIVASRLRRTDPQIAARFSRSRVEAGDIVMSIRATVGTTASIDHDLEGANLTQGTARIAPGETTNGAYLLGYLRADGTQNWIQQQVKGATFREITLARLRELPVAIPPIALQGEFARCHAGVDKLRIGHRASMERLDALFASIQHRAFRGEL